MFIYFKKFRRFLTPIFFILLFLSLINGQVDRNTDEEEEDLDRRETEGESDLFMVKVRVLEIPGEEHIRVYGKKENVTDSFGVNHSVVRFTGLPFALPPVKNLRFQRPSLKVLTEDFQALNAPQPCPQLSSSGGFIGEEDCLFLNIYMLEPKVDNSTKKLPKVPVLIWFHGENLEQSREGKFGILTTGSVQELQAEVFIYKKILVVTPQYRLGSLGFLSTANEDLNGNVGLFDQLLALEWVQRFIGDFGGDPQQVTIMGHGSSAMSLGLLSTSDLARGLFHRLILMSGSPLSPVALDSTPKVTFSEIALQNSCPAFPTLQFVRCMQERRLESLILSDDRLVKGKHLGKIKLPVPIIQKEADGRFLPPIIHKHPSNTITQGNFDPVPLIIGVSSSEMTGFLPSLAGKSNVDEVSKTIFSSNMVLRHFIRSALAKNFVDPELVSDMVAFEYFSGLNVTDRQEQANDLVEEMLSDFLYFIPALSMAKLWSRFAPVYFYVFDYVISGPSLDEGNDNGIEDNGDDDAKGNGNANQGASKNFQANHGSDLTFLMEGQKGSGQDREIAGNFVDFWINFIHKGSPLNSGIDWPQFREDTREFLLIGDEILSSSGFRTRQSQFWTELLPSVNNRICGSVTSGKRNSGRGGTTGLSSLAFSASSRRPQKVPLIFKDVSETDFSKKFFTYGSVDDDELK